jgi:hypothetical protein
MPLLDHFRPPLSHRRHSFPAAWATTIAGHLNLEVLPAGFFAEPRVSWGGIQVDIACRGEPDCDGASGFSARLWSPARAALKAPLRFGRQDSVGVRILNEEGGPKLAAAVELVTPANKQPAGRLAFTVRAAAYLQSDVCVILIDVVTTGRGNLHAELLSALQVETPPESQDELYAAAYRAVMEGEVYSLEVWRERLELGAPLPVLPLWIDPETALPLDLEATYQAACRSLRI